MMRLCRISPRRHTTRGRTPDRKCRPNWPHSLGEETRCPTQPRSNRVASQLLKGGHNSQTND
ncbi:hypothetical protein E2C01_083510 [Portunus trituberculatus]|uniref:Uncharacterized protein n=1 Tax=Portunus trituberculatus TaxID=210409 RepID=A0A5B7J1F2_PORTR|nr:hypothetical protein [Portunus trituberculatus]